MKDINLREAVHRREQQLPTFPSGLNERVMRGLTHHPSPRRGGLRRLLYAVAACLLLFFVLHIYNMSRKQHLVAQQKEQQEVPQSEPASIEQASTANDVEKIHVSNEPNPRVDLPKSTREVGQHHVHSSEEPQPTLAEEEQDVPKARSFVTRTIHLAPDIVMQVRSASDQLPAMEMPSMSELRARGSRLTAEVQRQIHEKKR